MALPNLPVKMTPDDYLEFDSQSDIKHEYVDGEIFAMAGASPQHNLICTYTIVALVNLIGDKPCDVYPSDMRLRVEATNLHAYPDMMVVCDDAKFADDRSDTLINPMLIIEVLSPSTERFDRGRKLQDYRRIPSLQAYLLISQDQARVEQFARHESDQWLYTDVIGRDNQIAIPALEMNLALSDVYRKVTFE